MLLIPYHLFVPHSCRVVWKRQPTDRQSEFDVFVCENAWCSTILHMCSAFVRWKEIRRIRKRRIETDVPCVSAYARAKPYIRNTSNLKSESTTAFRCRVPFVGTCSVGQSDGASGTEHFCFQSNNIERTHRTVHIVGPTTHIYIYSIDERPSCMLKRHHPPK